jgi:alpha-beta hydrolase superfamily lysophospholipase
MTNRLGVSSVTKITRFLQHTARVGVLMLLALPVLGAPLPLGKNQVTLDIDGEAIEVYTYKPERYARGAVLLTLHGVGRNAPGYRDHAIPIADRHGFLIVAPLFDRKRFPTWRYQHGGIARSAAGDATLQVEAEERWMGRTFQKIVDAVRALENAPGLPYHLLGHSGGGQSLSRVAGFMTTHAGRIVIANPGSYLWPTREVRFPDGYGALHGPWSGDEALRGYLAQPITLLLGTADVKQDADLTVRETAAIQGANRYERGHNAYRAAQSLAQARGWAFNWKVIDVPGVGHSARRMFGSAEAAAAFNPTTAQ